MRRLGVILASALLLAACGQADRPDMAQDVSEAPNVSPTAAPGVAFRYFFRFELPDEAISGVQEQHASRCESLGTNRCRITDLTYSVNEDEAVSASLTVKLAPDIARQFGKEATGDVKAADGRLRSTQFTGTDTEPTTTEASRQQSDLQTRIADIERQLASTSRDTERAQLQAQLNELRSQVSQAQATIAGARAQLASTPMTFNYYGRGGISGFRTNPVREAARLFVSSIVTMVSVLLKAIAILLPWAVLLALIVWFARTRFGHAIGRFFGFKRSESEENE
jgi:hypothetical protein